MSRLELYIISNRLRVVKNQICNENISLSSYVIDTIFCHRFREFDSLRGTDFSFVDGIPTNKY